MYTTPTLCLKMALLHRTEWRLYVLVRTKLGQDAGQIKPDLNQSVGGHCPSYCTVSRWVSSFKNGRESFEDDPRT